MKNLRNYLCSILIIMSLFISTNVYAKETIKDVFARGVGINNNIGSDTKWRIIFSAAMDVSTLKENIIIKEKNSATVVEITQSMEGDRTIFLKSLQPYKYSTEYILTIKKEITSATGKHLTVDYNMDFKTEIKPEIIDLTDLINAIKLANKQLTDIEVENYGQADINTYKLAIVEAQKVVDKADATKLEVDAAIETLDKAKTKFELTINVEKQLVANNEQEFYNILKNALENCETTVKVKVSNYNDLDYKLDVINRIVLEYPEVDYGKATLQAMISDYGGLERIFEITIIYMKDASIIKQQKEEAQKKVQEILNTVINNEMTDAEKELALHDYIVKTADYNIENYKAGTTTLEDHTAYGVLINKRGVCESYAKAMYELLNGAGIECKYVTGYGHVWNIVKLEDQWYNLDATWDDPVFELSTNADIRDMVPVRHKYFNVTDAIFNQDHKRGAFEEKNYPACTGTKYSYENMDVEEYTADGSLIEKVTSESELDSKILLALQNKKTVLYIRLKGFIMDHRQLIGKVNEVIEENNLNIRGSWSISMPDEIHAEYRFNYN